MFGYDELVADYLYELRRGDEIIATGHLSRDEPLEVGDQIRLAGHRAEVRTIEPRLSEATLHLVLEAEGGLLGP